LLRRIVLWTLVTLLLACILTLLFKVQLIRGDATALVFVDPPSQYVELGDSFTVNVSITDVSNLFGYEFDLYYPNNFINGTGSVIQGDFLKSDGVDTAFFVINFTDNYNATYGLVEVVCVRMGSVPGVNGNGTLATISFKSLALGISIPLHLADVFLSDSNAALISNQDFDGTVSVFPLSPTSPSANFTWSPPKPTTSESTTFDASSSMSGWDGKNIIPIVVYNWDFGDSNSMTTSSPIITHLYRSGGTYNVTLTVTDSEGLNFSTSQTVIVYVLVTFDQVGVGSDFTGTILTVDGTGYDVSDLPQTFTWEVGSSHTFAYGSPLVTGAKQCDWNFTSGLSTLQSDSIAVTGPGSVTGNYVTKVHDVGVTSLVANRTWVYRGWPVEINVTIKNNGDFDETVNVTLCYNMTAGGIAGTQTVPMLAGQSKTIAFTWDTTGVQPHWYYNYTLTAVASIPADFTPADNTLTDGNVTVRMSFDVNGDGRVDGRDIAAAARAFGSYSPSYLYPGSPASPTWNPDLDFNLDNRIDGRDLSMVARHFGQSYAR
jgi:PKD repeat protein